jgi:phosphatidylglycerophosphate synthase
MTAIREAIVVAGPGDAGRRIAGLPLLLRTLLTLQRAGIERCTLVGAEPPRDARLRLPVETARELRAAADDAPRLVVGPGAVIDAALVDAVGARVRPGAVLEVEQDGVHVRVAPGRLVAADDGPRVVPPAGTLRSAAAPAAILERALLEHLGNPRDGYLDRLVFRRGSRLVTPLLLRTPLSAGGVTLLNIVLGVAGGLLLGAGGGAGVAAGVALLVASGVLDCADGEVARLRFTESTLGHWLDVVGDTAVHGALLAGVAIHLARAHALPGWPVLALLAAGIAGAFGAITWSEQTEERRRRVRAWENRVLDGVLAPLSTRDWHVLVVAFALAGRLEWLVVGAAGGAHVFWLLVAWLLRRVLGRATGVPAGRRRAGG